MVITIKQVGTETWAFYYDDGRYFATVHAFDKEEAKRLLIEQFTAKVEVL